MIKLKCPECNANLEVENDRIHAFCSYCGTKVIVNEVNDAQEIYLLGKRIDDLLLKKNDSESDCTSFDIDIMLRTIAEQMIKKYPTHYLGYFKMAQICSNDFLTFDSYEYVKTYINKAKAFANNYELLEINKIISSYEKEYEMFLSELRADERVKMDKANNIIENKNNEINNNFVCCSQLLAGVVISYHLPQIKGNEYDNGSILLNSKTYISIKDYLKKTTLLKQKLVRQFKNEFLELNSGGVDSIGNRFTYSIYERKLYFYQYEYRKPLLRQGKNDVIKEIKNEVFIGNDKFIKMQDGKNLLLDGKPVKFDSVEIIDVQGATVDQPTLITYQVKCIFGDEIVINAFYIDEFKTKSMRCEELMFSREEAEYFV